MDTRNNIVRFNSKELGGTYVACMEDVTTKLATFTKPQLIRMIQETWPELKAEGWTKQFLNTYPSYVLAIILSQV